MSIAMEEHAEEQQTLSAVDDAALRGAVELLEHDTFSEALLGIVGSTVNGGLKAVSNFVPSGVRAGMNDMLSAVLKKTFETVLMTLDKKGSGLSSSGWFGRVSVALSGGVGGFFGIAGTSIELPVTTALLMRAIAQVAVREGEDLSSDSSRIECLNVFALGSKGDKDTEGEGYYAARLSLAQAIPSMVEKTIQELLPRAVAAVAERFAVPITFKVGSQMVPGLGAAAGVLVNSAFADHFDRKARGHFTVRRLERKYGAALVSQAYNAHRLAYKARSKHGNLGPNPTQN